MYTIKVTRDQYDFIRSCLNKFHQDLVKNLDDQVNPFPIFEETPEPTVTVSVGEILKTKRAPKRAAKKAAKVTSKRAPYGFKLDGTPKKRPGRKAAK